jgi:uncharacterized phiE125 gp8 family phage protein
MALVLTSGPGAEPVTVAEAKTFLRIDGNAEDVLIASLILTSRLHIETALEIAMIDQGWRLLLDRWPVGGKVSIPLAPLRAVAAVRVLDRDGTPVTLDPASYVVDAASRRPRLVCNGAWPAPGRPVQGIEIDLVAGYGADAASVPAPLRQAVLLLTAHWYEHRDPIEIGRPETNIPAPVSDLLLPFREKRL